MLLDTFSNSIVAYSLRKVRAAYSGSAIRVVRDSDDAELDVGFSADGGLDTTALSAFVDLESDIALIKKWYDQKGSYDAVQNTKALMPSIVLRTEGLHAIYCTGGSFLEVTSFIGSQTNSSIHILWRCPGRGRTSDYESPQGGIDFSDTRFVSPWHTTAQSLVYYDGTVRDSDSPNECGDFRHHVLNFSGSSYSPHENGRQIMATTSVTAPPYTRLRIGKNAFVNGDIDFMELVFFSEMKTASDLFTDVKDSFPELFPYMPRVFVSIGDSISTTYYAGLGQSWMRKAFPAAGLDRWFSFAKGGYRIQDVIDNFTKIAGYVSQVPAVSYHAVIFAGTNDIYLDGITGPAAYARLKQLYSLLISAGFTTVSAVTMLPRDSSASNSALETKRQAYNDLILADTDFEFVLDVEQLAIGVNGEQDSLTYYVTGTTHLSADGEQMLADAIALEIQTLNERTFMSITTNTDVTGTGSGSSSSSGPTRTYLTSADVAYTNTGSTTTIAELSPSLAASKEYRVTWYIANSSTTAAAVWRVYPSYPSGFSAAYWSTFGTNPADMPNSATPANDTLAVQLSEGTQAGDFIMSRAQCTIKTTTAGTLTFGLRFVVAGTGTVLKDYSYVEVEEI